MRRIEDLRLAPLARMLLWVCGRRHHDRPPLLFALLVSLSAHAEISTDGTLGPVSRLSGDMTIGADLGATRGANLFHSFSRFDVNTGERATFTGPAAIQRVIGRVTGPAASTIDGTLRSQVGQADVFLINPKGIVFGPHAQVDVPAAFHASTADELRFRDGSRFSATDPNASTLSMATPESFGFLSPQPASLVVNGSQLTLKEGKTASLTAGDVAITGSAERRASFRAPGGGIRIEAVGKPGGRVPVDRPSDTPGAGTIAIDQADLATSGDGGGAMALRAGAAQLTETTLAADNQGDSPPLGGLDLSVAGALTLSASRVQSNSFARGASGGVWVRAEDLTLRQDVAETLTGLFSEVEPAAQGAAGGIDIALTGALAMQGAVAIESSTWGVGDGGAVRLTARSLLMDGAGAALRYRGPDSYLAGIDSEAASGSSGHAGDVDLTIAETLTVLNSGGLSSSTSGIGDAGTVRVRAGDVLLDGASVYLASVAWPGSTGDAGTLDLAVDGLLEVLNGAQISSSTFAAGNAGTVRIQAGEMRLDGSGAPARFTGIASTAAADSTGDAGTLDLAVSGWLEVLNGAVILSDTWAAGNAGTVRIQAGEMRLDGSGALGLFTGIASNAAPGSTGDAGVLDLAVDGRLEVLNGAQISSSAFAAGNAGTVRIQAGEMRLDGSGAPALFTGIASGAAFGSTGDAGALDLAVDGRLEVLNGAAISSDTWAAGNAGTISIQAGEMRLDGFGAPARFTGIASTAASGSTGDAGALDLAVDGLLEVLNGAQISSSAFAAGNAGTVRIQAGEMRLDGSGAPGLFTGIASGAAFDSTGDAGALDLAVDGRLEILNGAAISSSTLAEGDAGTVRIRTADLTIDGAGRRTVISSRALAGATGQVGDIDLIADRADIRHGGEIAIDTEQTLGTDAVARDNGHRIRMRLGRLTLDNGLITAASTGNVPASAIEIQGQNIRLTDDSRIVTESRAADAGPITIGGGILWLTDSQIATSAEGAAGDGGDIALTPDYLILDGGFVQANTAASGARGGDIRIDTRALIASQGQLQLGGTVRQVFAPGSGRNVIQAAAPGGEQGTISVTAPDLDLTASLAPLAAPFQDPDDLLTDACQVSGQAQTSSLVERGAGGLPPDPADPTSVSLAGWRLERLLHRFSEAQP